MEQQASQADARLEAARAHCWDLAASVRGLAPVVAGSVADRIVTARASNDGPLEPLALLAEELTRGTEDVRAGARSALLGARDALRAVLAAMAAPGTAAPPDELNVDLLAEPAPTLPPNTEVVLPDVPGWLRATPWLWRGKVRDAVHEQLDEPLRHALSRWADALRVWTGKVLDRPAEQHRPIPSVRAPSRVRAGQMIANVARSRPISRRSGMPRATQGKRRPRSASSMTERATLDLLQPVFYGRRS